MPDFNTPPILQKDDDKNKQVVQLGLIHNFFTNYVIALAGLSRTGARLSVFATDPEDEKVQGMVFLPTASMDALCAAWMAYREEQKAKGPVCVDCGTKLLSDEENGMYCAKCCEECYSTPQ